MKLTHLILTFSKGTCFPKRQTPTGVIPKQNVGLRSTPLRGPLCMYCTTEPVVVKGKEDSFAIWLLYATHNVEITEFFPSFRFYVKSDLEKLGYQNLPFNSSKGSEF